jgi:hypothetical protein
MSKDDVCMKCSYSRTVATQHSLFIHLEVSLLPKKKSFFANPLVMCRLAKSTNLQLINSDFVL